MATNNIYGASSLTGGGVGALDAIDGDLLSDGDKAVVIVGSGKVYTYTLDADSAATPSSPGIISPVSNAGDKRWLLSESYVTASSIPFVPNAIISDTDVQAAIESIMAMATGGTGTRIISGGNVTWVSGYTYRVSAATYYIEETGYTSSEDSITLDASDETYDRIDVIALDTNGDVVKITGTASANPVRPDVDPTLYVMITFIYVVAASSSPDNENIVVYQENAEWTVSASAGTIVSNSTTAPRTGTYCIDGTSVAANTYFTAVSGESVPIYLQTLLVFYIRLKAAWDTRKTIRIQWMNGTANVGGYVTVGNGKYGLNVTTIGSYQQIVIPITDFIIPSGSSIDRVRMTIVGNGANVGFYIDDVVIQSGSIVQPPVVITGDVFGPANNDDAYVPQWNGANSKTLQNGFPITAAAKTILDDATIAAIVTTLGLDKVPIIVSWPGKPDDSAVISVWPPACTIPANLTGATYHGVVDPATEVVVSLSKNGAAAFGTMTVAAGSTDVATLSSSETAFNGSTDRLDIVFPTQDADWSGVSIKVVGVRS